MFKFLSHISQAAPPISRARIREEILERYYDIGRSVAQRFVRGNVNIKAGRFMTAHDLAQRKKDIGSR